MAFHAHTSSKDSDKWHSLKAHLVKVADRAEELADKFKAGKIIYCAGIGGFFFKCSKPANSQMEDHGCGTIHEGGERRNIGT